MASKSDNIDSAKPAPEAFRYDAFISYRHVDPDRQWAKWLHTALETYLVPRSVKAAHGVPPRARRVFRDEEELSASANLSAEIDDALRQSRFLIVICSPRTPDSLWVNKEVERFRELGRSDQILALLIEGEPRDAFPRALREIRRSVVDSQGLTQEQVEEVEPLAADVRAFGSRGHGHTRGVAKLRLLAKILGLHFDDLVQRDRLRQRRRRMQTLVAAMLVAALTVSVILFATRARALRRSNELARRFDAALNLHEWTPQRVAELDSLLAEWSQISPDDSAAGRGKLIRALASDADGQMHEPYLQPADVERINGELALLNQRDNALASPLNVALQSRLRAWQTAFELKPPFKNLAQSPWQFLERIPGNNRALSMVGNGQELGSRIPIGMSVRVTMTLEKDWEDSLRSITLRLTSDGKDEQDPQHQIFHGYMFMFAVKPGDAPQSPADYGMTAARAKGGSVALEMIRQGGASAERSRRFDAGTFPSGPVRLTLTREGDKLRFQVNDLPPLEMVESFPAPESESSYLGFGYNGQAKLSEFSVYRQLMPPVLNPLEAADAHFARKEFDAALSVYQSAATTEHRTLTRQEAQFKQALCLSRLGRAAEAVALLEPLVAESGDRWPAAAGYELWLLYLQQNNTEAASQLIDVLHARFTSEVLARVTSEEMRAKLVGSYKETSDQFGFLRRATDEHVKHLQDVIRAAEVLGVGAQQVIAVQVALARSHEGREEFDQAVNVLESAVNNRSAPAWMAVSAITDYSTLMRQRHQPEIALKALERLYGKEVNDDWFYIERAKLYRAMKRPEDALADLALADRVKVSFATSKLLAMAHMMRGFIDEEKGDTVAARKEWKAGFAAMRERIDLPGEAGGSPTANGPLDLQHAMILFMIAPLAEASDGELQGVMDELFAMMVNMPSVNVMQRSAMRIPAAPIRAFFRDPRGHKLAKDFAFSESPPARQAHAEGALLIEKLVEFDAFASNPSAEQTAIVSSVAERFLSLFRDGRINAPQLLQLILAWKGNSGIFGWKGLSASLDQELRCSLAYVVGMRYRQLSKPEEARDLFRQAIDSAAKNKAVVKLANQELQTGSPPSGTTRPAIR